MSAFQNRQTDYLIVKANARHCAQGAAAYRASAARTDITAEERAFCLRAAASMEKDVARCLETAERIRPL